MRYLQNFDDFLTFGHISPLPHYFMCREQHSIKSARHSLQSRGRQHEQFFEWVARRERHLYAPGIPHDHRADLEELGTDGTAIAARQLGAFQSRGA